MTTANNNKVRIHCGVNILSNEKTEDLYAAVGYYKLFCVLAVNTSVSLHMTIYGTCKIHFRLSLAQSVALHIFPLELIFFSFAEELYSLHIQISH